MLRNNLKTFPKWRRTFTEKQMADYGVLVKNKLIDFEAELRASKQKDIDKRAKTKDIENINYLSGCIDTKKEILDDG